ncbi:hypothetical protein HDU97_010385 [Phlyctochytrium planicorne]|nr:hypothetical protein HDU97_010385 [Phlyctochytrium planicorne]
MQDPLWSPSLSSQETIAPARHIAIPRPSQFTSSSSRRLKATSLFVACYAVEIWTGQILEMDHPYILYFSKFAQKVLRATSTDAATAIVSLFYMERLRERVDADEVMLKTPTSPTSPLLSPQSPPLSPQPTISSYLSLWRSIPSGSEHRVWSAALMLADANLNDNAFLCKSWSEVTGIAVAECVAMRRCFLSCVGHDLGCRDVWDFGPRAKVYDVFVAEVCVAGGMLSSSSAGGLTTGSPSRDDIRGRSGGRFGNLEGCGHAWDSERGKRLPLVSLRDDIVERMLQEEDERAGQMFEVMRVKRTVAATAAVSGRRGSGSPSAVLRLDALSLEDQKQRKDSGWTVVDLVGDENTAPSRIKGGRGVRLTVTTKNLQSAAGNQIHHQPSHQAVPFQQQQHPAAAPAAERHSYRSVTSPMVSQNDEYTGGAGLQTPTGNKTLSPPAPPVRWSPTGRHRPYDRSPRSSRASGGSMSALTAIGTPEMYMPTVNSNGTTSAGGSGCSSPSWPSATSSATTLVSGVGFGSYDNGWQQQQGEEWAGKRVRRNTVHGGERIYVPHPSGGYYGHLPGGREEMGKDVDAASIMMMMGGEKESESAAAAAASAANVRRGSDAGGARMSGWARWFMGGKGGAQEDRPLLTTGVPAGTGGGGGGGGMGRLHGRRSVSEEMPYFFEGCPQPGRSLAGGSGVVGGSSHRHGRSDGGYRGQTRDESCEDDGLSQLLAAADVLDAGSWDGCGCDASSGVPGNVVSRVGAAGSATIYSALPSAKGAVGGNGDEALMMMMDARERDREFMMGRRMVVDARGAHNARGFGV